MVCINEFEEIRAVLAHLEEGRRSDLIYRIVRQLSDHAVETFDEFACRKLDRLRELLDREYGRIADAAVELWDYIDPSGEEDAY